jgi:putative heme iron utilization protein
MTDKEKTKQLMESAEALEAHFEELKKLQSETSVCMDEIGRIIGDIKQLSATTTIVDEPAPITEVKSDAPKAMTLNDRFRLMRGDTD